MSEKYYKTIDVDVCVVGGSSSGMPAAINASDAGAKVVILEKTNNLGGTLAVCCGFFGVESPTQKRLGVHDTAEEAFRDLIQVLYWNVDARLVHGWMNGCGKSVEWLESLGMEFNVVEPFQGFRDFCRRTYHVSTVGQGRTGTQMANCMKAAIAKKGIEVLYKTRATHLLKDETGAVCGVEAEDKDGKILVRCKAAVLATGSISNNKELIKRFYDGDDYADTQVMARVAHNTGDGLIMAEEAGAKIGNLSTLFMGPHNHGRGHSELTGMFVRRPHSLKVNVAGERFADEGLWTNSNFGWMLSFATDKQPGKMTWAIFDDKMVKDMIKDNETMGYFEYMSATQDIVSGDNQQKLDVDEALSFYKEGDYKGYWLDNLMAEIDKEEKAGRMKRCSTVEEMAEFMGCREPERLRATLERYNIHCKNQYDADFLKAPRHLVALDNPPYYIFRAPSGVDTFIGGVHVNYDLNVIDPENYPIRGLYSAGTCTSGWLNRGYAYYGSELSFCLYSGRTSGQNAAKYALK